jgi:predicted phage-related endonuclease
MPIIEYKTEAEWLAERRKCITSSEIAALFGESNYCTEFELFHRKRNNVEISYEDDDRKKWGRRLETPISEGIGEDEGWDVKLLKVFMTHAEFPKYGSSFDFEIRRGNEKGLLELKNVDFKQYKEKWLVDGEEIEAPTGIEIQLQSELEVYNSNHPHDPATFGVIGALIGGNKPIVIERKWDREIGRLMLSKAKNFWDNVDKNIQPLPDFQRDGEIIKLLYAGTDGEEIDLTANNRIASLVAEYPSLQATASAAKKAQDAAKAEIAAAMKNAALGKVGEVYITRKTIQRAGYTVDPCSYVDMRIKQPKGEKK